MEFAAASRIAVRAPIAPIQGRRCRIAVIGCGAVAQQFHIPVLAGHEGVELVAFVDRDSKRVGQLATDYRVKRVYSDAGQLNGGDIDATVVATPPFHHAKCCIELARRGIHVLVEKPMATRYADAVAMVEAAEEAGTVLSVGLFRRLLPNLRMLRALLEAEFLGRPLRVDLEGGAVYGWPAATLGNMRKDWAGGGVLMDMGPHYFDQLLAVFDGPGEILEYRDNALGGIESDCVIRFQMEHRGEPVEGRMELSRTRNLRNSILVECERGEFEILPGERYRVEVRPHGVDLTDSHTGKGREPRLQASWADEPETDWYETFRAEIDDWVEAIRAGNEPRLSGRSALPSLKLIDDCYQAKQPLDEPWVGVSRPRITGPRAPRRVLLTGATGFIGCRTAEILALHEGIEVRALVHNPASASRLARLPVEMVQADLRDAAAVHRAMDGCDAVVHCAIGTTYGDRKAIFDVTVGGTRNLVDAALRAGATRFVHLSTIAVHGNDVAGILDESTPVRPGRGDTYSESKTQAERLVLAARERGLSPIVLRPTCVYGPFGTTFIMRPIDSLKRGGLVLAGSEDTPSNTVYVDNLVEAIVRSLVAGDDLSGEVFTIGDAEERTWGEFYGDFARRLGTICRIESACDVTNGHAGTGWIGGLRQLATSDELKALAKRALWTDPIGRVPRQMLERSPALKEWIKRRLEMDEPFRYVRSANDSDDVLRITPRHATARIDKARRLLGYGATVTWEDALERTWQWLLNSRITK